MSAIPASSTLRALATFGLFAAVFCAFLIKVYEFDIWYHLSIGREVWTSLAIPRTEFLVLPNAGTPAVFHEWGFGVLVFLTQKTFGFEGLTILNALVLTTTFWLLFNGNQTDESSLAAKLAALGLLIWGVSLSRFYRPEIILYLALAAEIYCLERYLKNRRINWLLPIPLISLVLTQAHPSVIFILFVMGCYGLFVVWDERQERSQLWRQSGIFLTCLAATFVFGSINPYGPMQVLEPLFFAGQGKVLEGVLEFDPSLQSPSRNLFLVLAACSVVSLVVDRKRLILNAPMLLAFCFLAYSYQRNTALFAIVLFLPLTRALSIIIRWLARRLQQHSPAAAKFPSQALLVAALGLLATQVYSRVSYPIWGVGAFERQHPQTSAIVINEVRPPGNIFNFYDFGGYLGWKLQGKYQVFVDGRNNRMSRSLAAHNAIMIARPGWQNALLEYNVNTVVVPTMTLIASQVPPIISAIAESGEWYVGATGYRELLFFRKSAMPAELPPQYRLNINRAWQQIADDARFHIRHNSSEPGAYLALGQTAAKLGLKTESIRAYRQYLTMVPNDTRARQELHSIEAGSL